MNSPVESSLRRFAIFKSPGRRQCIPGWLEIEAEAELRGERRPRGIVGVIAAGILAAERGVLQLPEGGGRREDISRRRIDAQAVIRRRLERAWCAGLINDIGGVEQVEEVRSEEHTSELQSRLHLVCRLLLEKKKRPGTATAIYIFATL